MVHSQSRLFVSMWSAHQQIGLPCSASGCHPIFLTLIRKSSIQRRSSVSVTKVQRSLPVAHQVIPVSCRYHSLLVTPLFINTDLWLLMSLRQWITLPL